MDGSKCCIIRESDDQKQRADGWKRPRKADSETVSYLREVEEELKRITEVDEDRAHEQATNVDGGDHTSMPLLIDNVLAEIRYNTASLMCDKDSSMVLEQILHASASNPNKAIALILSRCEPYFLCLATNRFASHVLQTLLDLSGPAIVREVDTLDDELGCNFVVDRKGNEKNNTATESGSDEEHIPTVSETVLSLAACAKGNWHDLAKNFSGSHVGRALIRALTGCQMTRVNERRGCNRQYSSSSQRASVDGIIGKWGEPSSTFPRLSVPESFKLAVSQVCEEIAEWRPVDLQKLICCTSGGPFLISFIASCASGSCDVNGEQSPICLSQDSPAMKVIKSSLEWEKGKSIPHDIVYGMAGEPVGSHFLEATIWLAPIAFLEKLHVRCLFGELREYCVDRNSNFVVQAILKRLANEELMNSNDMEVKGEVAEQGSDVNPPSCKEDGSNINNTSTAVRLAKILLEELLWPTEANSFESEFLSSVPSGVLWAIVEVAQRLLPDLQCSVRDAIGRISTGNRPLLLEPDQKGTSSSVNREAFAEARIWLPKLLSPCLLNDSGSESIDLSINGGIDGQHRSSPVIRRRSITVNVPGAQAIRSMLHFSRVNESAPVVGAISVLPQEVLVAAAKDSTAGRCIIDPVLALEDEKQGKKEYRKVFRDAKLAIARAFKLKCFSAVPMDIKCNMADELCGKSGSGVKTGWANCAERVKALSNTAPSGMTVVQKLQLHLYGRDKKGWKESIMRHGKRAEAFELAFGKGSTTIATKQLRDRSDNAMDVTTVIKIEKKGNQRRHGERTANNDKNGSTAVNEDGSGADDTGADRLACKIAKRNKKERTAESERETALDQLLEGMGGRSALLNDSDTKKMTTEGEIAAIWRKPGRHHSTTHSKCQNKKSVGNEDSKGVVKKKQKMFHNEKQDGNKSIDGVPDGGAKGNTFELHPVKKVHTKKKVIHDSSGFRLFK